MLRNMLSDFSSSPTARLRAEHELILEVVEALGRAVKGGGANDGPDLANVDRCIDFFRLYVDEYHHGKEEGLLFPALGRHGLPIGDGPIAMMLDEHVEGRSLVKAMVAALDRVRRGDAGARADLEALAFDYSEMISAHIDKENNILFDMADSMIEGPELDGLLRSYEELATQEIEGHHLSDLDALAQKILVSGH
jgi:hemerythrin-like domain-containing protein